MIEGKGVEIIEKIEDEEVDDIKLRIINEKIKMVKENLIGESSEIEKRKKIKNMVLIEGKMKEMEWELKSIGIKIEKKVESSDERMGMKIGEEEDRMDKGNKIVIMERIGNIIVGEKEKKEKIVIDEGNEGKDKDRSIKIGKKKGEKKLIKRNIRKIEIKKNDVVVVKIEEIDELLEKIGSIEIKNIGIENKINDMWDRNVVLNKKEENIL